MTNPLRTGICSFTHCDHWCRPNWIFCRMCYGMLPTELRKGLWTKIPGELSRNIAAAKQYLQSEYDKRQEAAE